MFSPSRRSFLGASLSGLASSALFGAEPAPAPLPTLPKLVDDPTFQPHTLFLTWQRDPTTTMTVQWIGTAGETSDTNIYYWQESLFPWFEQRLTQAPKVKPYPLTDFKVYRAELTGLKPGTDYQFRVGKNSPVYRFRTMPAKANDTIHFI